MQTSSNSTLITWFFRLATFVLIISILRLAQDVLMPVAFAILLSFLLTPMVLRLSRWGLPKSVAIIVTVSVAFTVIAAIGWVVTSQAVTLGKQLPNYEQNLRAKIARFKQPDEAGFARVLGMLDTLGRDIKAPQTPIAGVAVTVVEPRPVAVEVKSAEPGPLELGREYIGPILAPLGVAGIVVVFVVAMLFQRDDLRDRFVNIVSAGRLNIATEAVDDASRRITRYLWMQLVVNATYGIPIGIGLYLIGVPSALLWGLMATLLRFIPFLGPWIAAMFPIVLTIAVDPGWTMLFYTLALFAVMELISNNLIEVVLYGASTGISNLALLVAAVFWTWLWGIGGLILSTPLTACLLVMGKYVPGLRVFDIALGKEPVMEPPAQLYQRMLSMESEDMLELAARYIKEHSLEEFYDDVFIPALILSEEDRHNGALAPTRQAFILQSSRELIDELERRDEAAKTHAGAETNPDEQTSDRPMRPLIFGIPARDEADELVGLMLAHLLRRAGVPTAVGPLAAQTEDALAAIERYRITVVYVSALPPSAISSARQMSRRVRAQNPAIRVVVGIWSRTANVVEVTERLGGSKPDAVVTNLAAAVIQLVGMAPSTTASTTSPFAVTDNPVSQS